MVSPHSGSLSSGGVVLPPQGVAWGCPRPVAEPQVGLPAPRAAGPTAHTELCPTFGHYSSSSPTVPKEGTVSFISFRFSTNIFTCWCERVRQADVLPSHSLSVYNSKLCSLSFFFSFFLNFVYLFMGDRGRDTGKGRSRLHAGSPMWDSILGPQDHTLGQRQELNC